MSQPLKTVAVRTVKPLVSDAVWERLRSVGGSKPAQATQPKPVHPQRSQAPRRKSLTRLAKQFRTDKAGVHKYTQHYQRHLQHLRDERFTLLEIGIGGYSREGRGGASLRMWKHFFRKAQIVGLDIHDKSFVDEPRIRTYQGSQVDEEVLRRIVADADDLRVVIDDGSHRCEHVRGTFAILFPLLPEGGIYAIEDTQTSYWPEYGGSEDRSDPTTTMGLVKELVDGLNYEEFVDESYIPSYTDLNIKAVHCYHNLVIIEKGTNAEGTNRRRILRRRYEGTEPPW